MNMGELAQRLLLLAQRDIGIGTLETLHQNTVEVSDEVFQILGDTPDFDAVVAMVRVAEEFNTSYKALLEQLMVEIKVLGMKHLGE